MLLGCIGAFWGFIRTNIMIIIISILLMKIGWMIYKRYSKKNDDYKNGDKGERAVINALSNLDDRYYLINDITLQQTYGNIDHILLGPNGIFAIETKNYNGIIVCDGDEWHRHYENRKGSKDYTITSPSKQANRNAISLKNFLSNSAAVINRSYLYINAILVFTEIDVDLRLKNPTVPVLKLDNIYNFIDSFKTNKLFTNEELEFIAKMIIDASKSNCHIAAKE
jgi:hypothetical protein